MRIAVDPQQETPVYLQIKQAIADRIRQGDLPVGYRLPATRDLAKQLGVNRGTVTMAYDELVADGLLESHVGRGTFVARPQVLDEPDIGRSNGIATRKMAWDGLFAERAESPVINALVDLYQVSFLPDVISFSGSFPDSLSFPLQEFRNAVHYAIRTLGAEVLRYGAAAGFERLREYLAGEMREWGAAVTAEDVLITNGSQQALDLIARALIEPGDTVVTENPTYPGAVNAFILAGARVIGVPVDDQGMRTDRLEQIIALKRPKLIYVVPSFQNPTGACLSHERRQHLMSLARQYGIPIVEDDYGSRLRFEGLPITPLKAWDKGGHVIYVSNFSKSLLPGLRLGWCVAARPVLSRLTAIKQYSDISTSPLLQAALWDFCRRKRYQAHLERVRPIYRERRDLVTAMLEKEFPPGTTWTRPDGGLFLWVRLPETIDATELLLMTRQRGVVFSRGLLFHVDGGGHNTMRLSYGHVTRTEIETGMRIIGQTVREMMKRHSSRTPDKFRKNALPLV